MDPKYKPKKLKDMIIVCGQKMKKNRLIKKNLYNYLTYQIKNFNSKQIINQTSNIDSTNES